MAMAEKDIVTWSNDSWEERVEHDRAPRINNLVGFYNDFVYDGMASGFSWKHLQSGDVFWIHYEVDIDIAIEPPTTMIALLRRFEEKVSVLKYAIGIGAPLGSNVYEKEPGKWVLLLDAGTRAIFSDNPQTNNLDEVVDMLQKMNEEYQDGDASEAGGEDEDEEDAE